MSESHNERITMARADKDKDLLSGVHYQLRILHRELNRDISVDSRHQEWFQCLNGSFAALVNETLESLSATNE